VAWSGLTRPLDRGDDATRRVPASEQAAGAAADAAFEAEPRETFAATVDRPLFSRSRRPAPPEPAAVAAAKPGENGAPFELSGVLIAGASRVAFLKPIAQPKTLRVLEGETIEGWKVERILPERVVIGNGGARAELTLKDRILPAGTGAARPKEPAPGRQAGAPPLPPGLPGAPQGIPRGDELPPEGYDGELDHDAQ
jgi:hypothetical protein